MTLYEATVVCPEVNIEGKMFDPAVFGTIAASLAGLPVLIGDSGAQVGRVLSARLNTGEILATIELPQMNIVGRIPLYLCLYYKPDRLRFLSSGLIAVTPIPMAVGITPERQCQSALPLQEVPPA